MCKKNIYRLCNVKRLEQDIKSRCSHGWRSLFQSGGAQEHVKNYRKFCELTTVTSQALKYYVIIYIP